jgi:hypothetical protein
MKKILEIHVAGRPVDRVAVHVVPGASLEYRAGNAVFDVCNARRVHCKDIKVVCEGRAVSWEYPNITPYPY